MSDHPVQARSVRVHWLAPSALLFLFAGWVTAILLAGGLELHRSAVAVPLPMGRKAVAVPIGTDRMTVTGRMLVTSVAT